MTAKDFVDTLMKDDNIGAEEAFTNAMSSKVSDALEKKRIELSRAYVSQPPTPVSYTHLTLPTTPYV